ncbi:MAG TPA: hypothetical protein VK601_07655 [Kofleriaceae bacterium]|nr:hypothetical protein [Kofleriaceae bacterium]
MHRSVVVSVLAAALGGSGCSSPVVAPADAAPDAPGAPTGYTSPPDGNGGLTPMAGFPGRSQPLGSAYRTEAMGVLAASDGSVWAAHADRTEATLEERALVVERFAPSLGTGAVVARATIRPFSVKPNRLDRVALCGHPSGEVTLAVFASTAGPVTAALVVTRFAADGSVLRTAYIDDDGAPVVDGHAAYQYGNDLDCASEGEDLFLVTSTLDLRLYRLAPDLSVRWSRPVMPLTQNILNQRVFIDTRVVVANDRDGGAVTAMTLWSEDRAAFAASFGAALPATSGAADVLVTRFSADGTRGPAGLLGGPAAELVRGVRADGDRVSVLTQITVPATHDIDMVLLAGGPALDHTDEAIAINLCDEDEVFDVIAGAGGGFVVAGSACATPGDTSTRVGFVATLGSDGRRQGVTWFTSQRDTTVEALAPAAAGELALAGIRNGPTTTGQSTSNEGWVGLVSAPAGL